MKREHKNQQESPINYLLNIENSLIDKSPYARHITNNGAIVENSYIIVDNSKTFTIPYSNDICKWNVEGFTIEMDCNCAQYLNGHGYHGTFVCQGNVPGNIDYWSFGIVKQRLSFYYYNGSQITTVGNTIIPLNEWHNIKMQYRNGVIKIYIDGIEEKSSNVSGTPQFSNSYNLVFMGYSSQTNNVKIKNIKIYLDL